MKKRLSFLLSTMLVLCLIIGSIAAASGAASDPANTHSLGMGETRDKNNINGNSYNRYNSVVRSYLCPTADGGYMRVYGSDDGTLLAEYYDANFGFVDNRYVAVGLPLFGGFYAYGGRYYVMTGDENPNEDPDREVFRVTCFDEDWQELGYDSIWGGNTVLPFVAARVSFAGCGNRLFIRTGHRMFDEDGINHQANMTVVFNTRYLTVEDYFCDVLNLTHAGYLSHSFNQFVIVDDQERVVCLDHGDAIPRQAVLGRYLSDANHFAIVKPGSVTYEYTPLFTYYGPKGDNTTAAMIGGLAYSSTSYLTVGTIAGQDENYKNNHAYNAYFTVTEKDVQALGNARTKITYLSSFTEDDLRYASNPQLVKFNDDRFLVMWNEFPVNTKNIYGYVVDTDLDYDETYLMKYVFIDGQGNLLTDIFTAPTDEYIFVSECDPIVRNNRVLWYVSNGDDRRSIVEIDLNGRLTVHENIIPDEIISYPVNLSRATVSMRSFEKIPETVTITADNLDDYVVVSYNGRPLERGKDYRLSDNNPISVRTSNGYIKSISLRLGTIQSYSYFPLSYSANWTATDSNLYLNSATRVEGGVSLNVYARRGIGYHVYRKELGTDGDYTLLFSVTQKMTDVCFDPTASRAKGYIYTIREFTYDKNGNEVLSDASASRTVKPEPGYVPTEPPTELPTDPPTNPPTDPPTEPPTIPPTLPPTEPPTAPSDPTVAPKLLGDADRNGKVTILDATVIQRYLAKLASENQIDLISADGDGNGKVTILDATAIQRWLAHLPGNYLINEPFYPTA